MIVCLVEHYETSKNEMAEVYSLTWHCVLNTLTISLKKKNSYRLIFLDLNFDTFGIYPDIQHEVQIYIYLFTLGYDFMICSNTIYGVVQASSTDFPHIKFPYTEVYFCTT